MTPDFIEIGLKLLDKGFAVAVAVLCLVLLYKMIPLFAQMKMVMIQTNEIIHINNKELADIKSVIEKNNEMLKEVREKL